VTGLNGAYTPEKIALVMADVQAQIDSLNRTCQSAIARTWVARWGGYRLAASRREERLTATSSGFGARLIADD
jgi:hypothetical protein